MERLIIFFKYISFFGFLIKFFVDIYIKYAAYIIRKTYYTYFEFNNLRKNIVLIVTKYSTLNMINFDTNQYSDNLSIIIVN